MTLEANFRLAGRCIGKALDEAVLQRGWPKAITVDNGLIESFNGRLDTRTTGAAIGTDPHLEALEAVHRPQHSRR